jgi:DNA segregation ATPase FtsK/SpoIIIE-like protein
MELIPYGLAGLGIIGFTMLTCRRKPENKIWRTIGVKNSKNEYPYLLDKDETEDGITYTVHIPDGINMKDFYDEKGRYNNIIIQSFANMHYCEIKPLSGHKMSIKVLYEKLATRYEFPVKFITESKSVMKIPIGVSLGGIVYLTISDAMPHSIIAGTSGFGKSTLMKIILTFMNCHVQPIDIYTIDMKNGVEFGIYENCEKVKMYAYDKEGATKIIKFLIQEMARRYRTFKQDGVKNIDVYNEKHPNEKMNRIILAIDECADLSKDKKGLIDDLIEIGRKGRAAGLHMLLATQYPTSQIINAQLKINLIGRICFKVDNYHDSMTILDHVGAEDIDIVGRAIYKRASVADLEFQAYYMKEEQCEELLQPTLRCKRVSNDELAIIFSMSGDEFV